MAIMTTPFQRLFILELLRDPKNATQAYIRAGGKATSATVCAAQLLADPIIRGALDEARREREQECRMEVADVLRMWCEIATADPNELVALVRFACRHCYGREFKYQWRDEKEWAEAINDAMTAHEKLMKTWRRNGEMGDAPDYEQPSCDGGFGFNDRLEPNSECPKCEGKGIVEQVIADTRKLKGPARRLYAGLKQTKDGIQVLMRDQDAASAMVARHLGMLNDKLHLSGSVGVPADEREALKKLSTEDLQTYLSIREKMGG